MNKILSKVFFFINIIILVSCASLGPGMDISKSKKIKIDGYKDSIQIESINMELINNLSNERRSNPSQFQNLISVENEYYIGVSDILSVAVWGVDEFTVPANSNNNPYVERQVRSNGTIFFPYVGEIKVAGLTVQDVREMISKKLNDGIFIDSQIDIGVVKYNSQKLTLIGEFKNPQIIYLNSSPLSLFEAMSIGGSNQNADLTSVKLIRDKNVHEFDFQYESSKSTLLHKIYLKDKDIIKIPNNTESRLYVIGESLRPKEIILKKSHMSLSQAISSAGGLNKSRANASKVFILRSAKNSDGNPRIFYINLKSAANLLLASNFKLYKQDIVFIGTSNISKWNSVIAQLFPFASLLNAVDNFSSKEN